MFEFEWDPEKSDSNFEKHGIDFPDAIGIFESSVVTFQSRYDGEPRFISVGVVDGRFICIVWTSRGEGVRRVISARSARRQERARYDQGLTGKS